MLLRVVTGVSRNVPKKGVFTFARTERKLQRKHDKPTGFSNTRHLDYYSNELPDVNNSDH